MTHGAVSSVCTTSTRGMRNGGFHQCVPTIRSRRCALAAISVGLMTDVLVASTASGPHIWSRLRKISCLSVMSSMTASSTKSASATASSMTSVVDTRSSVGSTSSSRPRPRSARKVRSRRMFGTTLGSASGTTS